MSLTFLEMQELTSDWLDDKDNGYFDLPTLKKRINLAAKTVQKHLLMANEYFYAKCVSTTLISGQRQYSLPSDFLEVLKLEIVVQGSGQTANTRRIDEVTASEEDNMGYNSSGDPYVYRLDKNKILFWPVPQSAKEIRLEYSYFIADMVGDSDVADLPQQYHEFVPIIAARDGFLKDGRDILPIKDKLKEYELLLEQTAKQRTNDSPRYIVTTDGGFGGL